MARYRFTSESRVEIQAKSSVHPIGGETNAITGEAEGEAQDGRVVLDPQPRGYIEMPIDALSSGHKLQDMEMRRRVDAKKYPTIRYELKEVSGGPESYKLLGSMTFHGVTQEFMEEARVTLEGDVLRVEGEHTFDIRDFGVKPPKILSLQVYPEVRIVAHLVARKA